MDCQKREKLKQTFSSSSYVSAQFPNGEETWRQQRKEFSFSSDQYSKVNIYAVEFDLRHKYLILVKFCDEHDS